MPVTKLTGVVIRNLKPSGEGSRIYYFDTEYKGLCLRVGKRDKTWAYHYRFNGKSRSPALGKYAPSRIDHMDRAGAISAANRVEELIEKGKDPKQLGNKALKPKPKPTTTNLNALERRVKQFLALYKGEVKASTYKQAERLLNGSYLDQFAQTDVGRITRVELVELLEDMNDTPAQANRLQAYLSKFFNWCWDRGYADPSPMAGLKKRFKEKSRKKQVEG